MVHAFGIFSGGLDSLLSARLLMDQGLTPTLLTFTSPFFPPDKALAGARALGLELTLVDIYDDLLPLIKNPPHGLGRNLNPCIDCHALMFRKAGELLAATGEPGFLFSGEVLGQRPMSQNPRALNIVAEDSGHRRLVLRPMSAKLLPPTEAEEKGWVDRERLLGLSGRSRRAQMDLAAGYGLDIPPPAGGCLLTDVGFSRRLRWLLDLPLAAEPAWPPARLVEMLKHGRLFSAEPGQWLIVGRHQADNQALTALAGPGDVTFHLESGPGPTVIHPYSGSEPGLQTLDLGRHLVAAYGDPGPEPEAPIRLERRGLPLVREWVAVTRPADWERFMIK